MYTSIYIYIYIYIYMCISIHIYIYIYICIGCTFIRPRTPASCTRWATSRGRQPRPSQAGRTTKNKTKNTKIKKKNQIKKRKNEKHMFVIFHRRCLPKYWKVEEECLKVKEYAGMLRKSDGKSTILKKVPGEK